MALETGTIIGDKYRISRRLGVGGMGEVWAGENTVTGAEVAIKIMLPAGMLSREVYARFKREAQVLGRIRSEYVAQVLDFLSDKKHGLTLIMELIPGQPLSAVIANEGKLSVEAMLDIASDVTRGLRDLHASQIVHRDLKPGNIVLNPQPDGRAKGMIIDFGVSRILSNPGEEEITSITRDDRVLGTLEYMAPEQIIGSRTATASADLYALGAMMYRAVAGHHCFGDLVEGKLVAAKLNQDAPPLDTGRSDPVAVRFSATVARLLSRRVRDRFTSADELLAEFDAIQEMTFSTQTAPMIEVSIVPGDDEEDPTKSLSLDTQASILVASHRKAEPISSPSSSGGSSLTPAISSQLPPLGKRTSTGMVALLLGLIVLAAAAGGVVGASIASKKVAARNTDAPAAASAPATAAAAPSATPSATAAATIAPAASASGAASAASAAPVASVSAAPSAVAAMDIPPVPVNATPVVKNTVPVTRPAASRKPPAPTASEEPPAAPKPTAAPVGSMYIPEGL